MRKGLNIRGIGSDATVQTIEEVRLLCMSDMNRTFRSYSETPGPLWCYTQVKLMESLNFPSI